MIFFFDATAVGGGSSVDVDAVEVILSDFGCNEDTLRKSLEMSETMVRGGWHGRYILNDDVGRKRERGMGCGDGQGLGGLPINSQFPSKLFFFQAALRCRKQQPPGKGWVCEIEKGSLERLGSAQRPSRTERLSESCERRRRERMGYAKRYTCPDRFFLQVRCNTTLSNEWRFT